MQAFYKIECQNDDGSFFDYRYVSTIKKVKEVLINDAYTHLNNGVSTAPDKSMKTLKEKGHAFFDIGNTLGYNKCFYVTKNRMY